MEQHIAGVALLLTGIMLFSYWLNYCMGSPMADKIDKVDVGAILFFIPRHFSDNRLARAHVLVEMWEDHNAALVMTKEPVRFRELRVDFERDRYEAGRKFFTWERSILCPVCLHWWLTVLVISICLIFDWLRVRDHIAVAGFIYLANHFIIRKIS